MRHGRFGDGVHAARPSSAMQERSGSSGNIVVTSGSVRTPRGVGFARRTPEKVLSGCCEIGFGVHAHARLRMRGLLSGEVDKRDEGGPRSTARLPGSESEGGSSDAGKRHL